MGQVTSLHGRGAPSFDLRLAAWFAGAGLLLLSQSNTALAEPAQNQPAPATVAMPADINPAPALPPATPEIPPDPFTTAIEQKLSALVDSEMSRFKANKGRSGFDAVSLDKLKAYYRAHPGQALWVTDTGDFKPSAGAVMEEIGRANDWGLDAKAFELPKSGPQDAALEARAMTEAKLSVAAIKYAWHAHGGRIDPGELTRWFDRHPRRIAEPGALLSSIADAPDPAVALRRLNPQHADFEALRQAWLSATGRREAAATPKQIELPPGPRLKIHARHDDIALLRERLNVPAEGDDATVLDSQLADAITQFMKAQGRRPYRELNDTVRAALNEPPHVADKVTARQIYINMERWRLMPEDLGELHIVNNLPEFLTRVYKNGEKIHEERIIVGKPESQTPVFSENMRFVVFQPEWSVPSSIKIKDLLPRLLDGDTGLLEAKGMRIVGASGKELDASRIDWEKIDIRGVAIVQYPGDSNPLGNVKFLFPNKHSVYMHDTSSRGLFSSSVRTFSHGCIRVRDPERLAEIVMEEDKGWTKKDVQRHLEAEGEGNIRVELDHPIPVHNVYFTVTPDGRGGVREFEDIYGHDERMRQALDGRPVDDIERDDPVLDLESDLEDLSPTKPQAAN